MARFTFGGYGGDQVSLDPTLNNGFFRAGLSLNATGTFWSASTGGTQYTDLIDPNTSAALTGVSTSSRGLVVPFKGPDGVTEGWLDFGAGRFKVTATDSGAFVSSAGLDSASANLVTTSGTATRGSLDARYTTQARGPLDPRNAPYNAAWDGTTNDGAAFRSCVADAITQGRAVLVPRGTGVLDVDSTSQMVVPLTAGVVFVPEAGKKSIIKVKSSAGNYYGIIGNNSTGVDLSGLECRGFTINQNNTGNPATAASNAIVGGNRNPILVLKATQPVAVTDMSFLDCDTNNVVHVSGATDVVSADRNYVAFSGGSAHDTSIFYIESPNYTCNDNYAYSAPHVSGAGVWAVCFLELHWGPFEAHGNKCYNFEVGCNVVGYNGMATGHLFDNDFLNVQRGIQLWPTSVAGGQTFGLDDVDIHDNRITLDHAQWTPGNPCCGMFLVSGQNLPMRNLRFHDNTVRLVNFTVANIQASDYQGASVYLTRGAGVGDTNIRITNNNLIGALGAGVHVALGAIRGLWVEENIMEDFGRSVSVTNVAYASAVLVTGTVNDGHFNRNHGYDSRATHLVSQWLDLSISSGTNNEANGNTGRCADGADVSLIVGPTTAGVGVFGEFRQNAHLVTGNFVPGSRTVLTSTGVVKTITGSAITSTWT